MLFGPFDTHRIDVNARQETVGVDRPSAVAMTGTSANAAVIFFYAGLSQLRQLRQLRRALRWRVVSSNIKYLR
jgi:plasmid replication initiation protein